MLQDGSGSTQWTMGSASGTTQERERTKCEQRTNQTVGEEKCLYKRIRWKPTYTNKTKYKEICSLIQHRERQLKREQKRLRCQRIEQDPASQIAVALQISSQRRAKQVALDKTTGRQMRPELFAECLNKIMEGRNNLPICRFTVEKVKHAENMMAAIKAMESNKAVGTDGLHVEMLKVNV